MLLRREDSRKLSGEEADDDACEEDDEKADDRVDDRLSSLCHLFLIPCGSKNAETTHNHKDDGNESEEGENEVDGFDDGVASRSGATYGGIFDIGNICAELCEYPTQRKEGEVRSSHDFGCSETEGAKMPHRMLGEVKKLLTKAA